MSSVINCRLVLVSLLILLSACGDGGVTKGRSGKDTRTITIDILEGMHPQAREISVETIPQNNCGGSAEVANEVVKCRAIAHTIEVGRGFEVNANGGIGFADTDVELGAAVSSELGYSYGTVEQICRSITVKAKPRTKMEHRISLQEIWEVGTSKIVVGERETTVPFSFRRGFALQLTESKDLGRCETDTSTSTPIPTHTPTHTPTPCPCQSVTEDDTLRCLIHAEAEAANRGDLQLIQQIFAPNATVFRGDTGDQWHSPMAYYVDAFALDYSDARHFDIHQIEITDETAFYTSGSSGSYGAPNLTPTPYYNENPSDHWVFGRNDQGCWVITRFEFNASHVGFP